MSEALRIVTIAVVALAIVDFASASDRVRVKGHFRKDGTYVPPHYRTAPDGRFYNNWSTYGNVNPYTGEFGKKLYPSTTKPSDLVPPFAIPVMPLYPSAGGAWVSPRKAAPPDIRGPSLPTPSIPRAARAKPESDIVEDPQTYEVTNCGFLNMRTGPGVRYPINQRLQNGVDGIVVIGNPVFNGATKWQQVKSRGVIGWVNAVYLRGSVVSPHKRSQRQYRCAERLQLKNQHINPQPRRRQWQHPQRLQQLNKYPNQLPAPHSPQANHHKSSASPIGQS